MDTWDAIRARRNVREFTEQQINKLDLDRILDAARRTPSSRNRQRWDFVVVTDPDRLQRLANVWQGAWHCAGSAATIALIAPADPPAKERNSIQYDLGQATMSIALAAADLGIGTGHAGVGDQTMARSVLGHPEDRECAWLISLGYPKDRPLAPIRNPNRRAFDDVVHRESW